MWQKKQETEVCTHTTETRKYGLYGFTKGEPSFVKVFTGGLFLYSTL